MIDPRLTRYDASVAAQLRTPFLIVGAGRARHSFVTQAFLTASPAPKGNAWREVLGKDMILKDQASIAYIAGAGAAHLTGANGIGVTTPLR